MVGSRLLRLAIRARARARWIRREMLDSLTPSDSTARCPLCECVGSRQSFVVRTSRDVFWGGRLVRYQCPQCDAIFGPERMLSLSEKELAIEYRDLYAIHKECDSSDKEISTFMHLEPRLGGKYLNFGAGCWSSSLSLLRQQGHDVVGFEPYANKGGSDYILTSADDLMKLQFDGIFSNNLIEHLQHPVETMRMLAGLLRDGHSKMAHASTCYQYDYEYSRFHLFFFVGRSVEALARRSGLRLQQTNDPEVRCFLLQPDNNRQLTTERK